MTFIEKKIVRVPKSKYLSAKDFNAGEVIVMIRATPEEIKELEAWEQERENQKQMQKELQKLAKETK